MNIGSILCALILSFCIMALQGFPLWWINRLVHLRVLLVLLLRTIRYEWFYADILLFWVHGMHLLWFLSHARDCWFPCISVFRPSHLSVNQVWVMSSWDDGWYFKFKSTRNVWSSIGPCSTVALTGQTLYYLTMVMHDVKKDFLVLHEN